MKILIIGAEGQVGSEFRIIASNSNHSFVYANKDLLDLRDEKQIFEVIQHVAPGLVINCAAYTAVDNAEKSKLAGEQLIAGALTRHIILRTAWVFGASGGNFAKTMLRLGAERDYISVVDDQQGAPTSARGLAECCLRIADKIEIDPKRICWGIYHFTGAPYVNWFQFARAIFREAKRLGLIVAVPNLKLNCSKILREFGVLPDPWDKQLLAVLEEIRDIAASEKNSQ